MANEIPLQSLVDDAYARLVIPKDQQIADLQAQVTTLEQEVKDLEQDLADCEAGHVDPPVEPPVVVPPDGTQIGNASNTGVPAGTVLTNSGSITTNKAGQVIEAKNVTGTITVNHANCVIRKCKVTCSGGVMGIRCRVAGTIIEDTEIIGSSGNCGIDGSGTFRRVNIHGFENAINVCLTDGPGGLYNSYLWGMQGGSSAHFDTVQIDGSVKNWEIAYNTLENLKGDTSCVMIDNYFGGIDNIDVHDNVMIGGGSITVYSDEQSGNGWSGQQITNVKYRNNKMDKGYYGYQMFRNNSPVWTGNTDRKTGAAI